VISLVLDYSKNTVGVFIKFDLAVLIMKVEFDVVRPNLLVTESENIAGGRSNDIYFSMNHVGYIVPTSMVVDELVKSNGNRLMVRESDLKIVKTAKPQKDSDKFTIPLREYLDAYEKFINDCEGFCIGSDPEKAFGFHHEVNSFNYDDPKDIRLWGKITHDLKDPEKAFDEFEADSSFMKLDREKTLSEMQKLQGELDSEVGDFWVSYSARLVHQKIGSDFHLRGLGRIHISELKGVGDEYDAFRESLIKVLDEVDGPTLSYDCHNLSYQASHISHNLDKLMENAGDIITSPKGWQERLFLIDP